MSDVLPLSALLSGAVVAFTIELDNEAGHGIESHHTRQHQTGERTHGLWLTSVVMWANSLRYLVDGEATVVEVARRARTHANLDGIRRWGYVTIDGHGRGRDNHVRARPDSVLALTADGREACERWAPLPDVIERRWRERFGTEAIGDLRAALIALAGRLPAELPDCLPILGYGLFCRRRNKETAPPVDAGPDPAQLPLWSLLSRVTLAFALGYERETLLSLAVMADVLRVIEHDDVPVADLPRRSGVSKEAIAMALKLLEQGHLIEIASRDRRRQIRLTDRGAEARRRGQCRITGVETAWRERFGASDIDTLRAALTPLAGNLTHAGSPLFAGLDPYPDGWRAHVRAPETLPWFPMVLHRGGWPDGA